MKLWLLHFEEEAVEWILSKELPLTKQWKTLQEKIISGGEVIFLLFGWRRIFGFCKKIIGKYSISEKDKKGLFRILTRTGTVSGEYGFVSAYQKKKKLIQSWKEDKNIKIKNFAITYEKYLDKNILYETKEADEEIIYRKQEFGKKDKINEDSN